MSVQNAAKRATATAKTTVKKRRTTARTNVKSTATKTTTGSREPKPYADPLVVQDRIHEMSSYGLPMHWILCSSIELQALREGVVSSNVLNQIEAYLSNVA